MNLKFDYVLTIRYDDSHSDYSMLCSSEMSEMVPFRVRMLPCTFHQKR